MGATVLRQPCHVLLKLGLLLQNTSVGFYTRDLGLLNLRAEVTSVVIRAPLFSTFFSPERGRWCTSVKGPLTWNSNLVV